MEQPKEQLISVGELAKKAGVTVRTLQYYDKTGLLKSTTSESGRRMYTRDDILKLQQILFLKSFGFSLEKINDNLLTTTSPSDLAKIFKQQRDILTGQIASLSNIVNLLNTVIPQIKAGEDICMEKLMAIIELMKQGNPYTFVLRYFGNDQLKNAASRFDSTEKYDVFIHNAEDVFVQMETLYRRGANPAGKEGQELAARWWDMVNDFTAGDPKMLQPLLSAGRDIDNWPEETREYQTAIRDFLGVALNQYLQNLGISLMPEEDKNTAKTELSH